MQSILTLKPALKPENQVVFASFIEVLKEHPYIIKEKYEDFDFFHNKSDFKIDAYNHRREIQSVGVFEKLHTDRMALGLGNQPEMKASSSKNKGKKSGASTNPFLTEQLIEFDQSSVQFSV